MSILRFNGVFQKSFLKKREKKEKILNIFPSTITRDSQAERKWEILKCAIHYKSLCNWILLTNHQFISFGKSGQLVNNTSNYHQIWRTRSACGTKVGCLFCTCLILLLNSKIGSACRALSFSPFYDKQNINSSCL